MALAMGGIYWVIERRERLAHERANGEADAAEPESNDGPNSSEQAE
jgi:hypothetical protein